MEDVKQLHLEITRDRDHLKISANEVRHGDVRTVQHYEKIHASMDKIGQRCQGISETLSLASRSGRLTREVLAGLRDTGQLFRDELFTQNAKEILNRTRAEHLILNIDDSLVHLPWELLHDGNQFLCQKFNMGRLVRTRQPVSINVTQFPLPPLKMLILADPQGDLKAAYKEGIQIRDHMEQKDNLVNVAFRSDGISSGFIREKIRNYDLVHFAGHADYNREKPGQSGWRLSRGIISAEDILKMSGTAKMPTLIFSNACQSARSKEWDLNNDIQNEIFGLANAFIMSGVKHYIGTFWEILDEPGKLFASSFYRHLLKGITVGEAMGKARLDLINTYGEETIVWASYLLYGDPSTRYFALEKKDDVTEVIDDLPRPAILPSPEAEVRAHEEVINFEVEKKAEDKKKSLLFLKIASSLILFVLFVFAGYTSLLKTGFGKYEQKALAEFRKGGYVTAIETCRHLQEKYPKRTLGYLIPANINFLEGNFSRAMQLFKKAVESNEGTDAQKADAFIGLGRIASIQGNTDKALDYYNKATTRDPEKWPAYLSKALLLDQKGDLDGALKMLDKAGALSNEQPNLSPITNAIKRKADFSRDLERRERVDQLVRELLDTFEESIASPPKDTWTSKLITIWLMDFAINGYSLVEGEDRLLHSNIIDHLIKDSRIRIVERSLLDKLMEELRLGRSRLADKDKALSLGRIVAARIILFGRIVHTAKETQVAVRFIETETGQVMAVVNETFNHDTSISGISENIAKQILEKISSLYPLPPPINTSS